MKFIDKVHNLSLHLLTLCGLGAVVSLAVNTVTALAMLVAERSRK